MMSLADPSNQSGFHFSIASPASSVEKKGKIAEKKEEIHEAQSAEIITKEKEDIKSKPMKSAEVIASGKESGQEGGAVEEEEEEATEEENEECRRKIEAEDDDVDEEEDEGEEEAEEAEEEECEDEESEEDEEVVEDEDEEEEEVELLIKDNRDPNLVDKEECEVVLVLDNDKGSEDSPSD